MLCEKEVLSNLLIFAYTNINDIFASKSMELTLFSDLDT